ncbi:MAG: vWA domain-containing protein [Anaerolineales bacterium]
MRSLKRVFSLAVFLAYLASAAFSPAGQEGLNIQITQIDTSQFPRVTFYVSVTDANGEPFAVDASRFIIKENGVEIPLDQVEGIGEVGPITTILVTDVSDSMNAAGKLDAAKAAAHEFVNRMRDIDQTGLVSFNTQVETVQEITSDQEALRSAIDSLQADSQTAMYDALLMAIEQLEGVGGRKAIIVLTDGLDNRSSGSEDTVINRIGPAGFSISAVGLGVPAEQLDELTGIDEEGLQSLADRAGGVYAFADDEESLTRLYETYAVSLQSEYAITYTSPSALRDGVNRALSVELASGEIAGAGGETRYNPGGLVPEVEQPASWPLFAGLVAVLAALVIIPMVIPALRGGSQDAAAKGGTKGARPAGAVRLKPTSKPRIRLK